MKKTSMKIGTTFMILLLTLSLHTKAQPDDDQPPTDGGPGCCDQNPDVPFDGGLAILLAAGFGYGMKKARDFRKHPIALKNVTD